MEVLRHGMLMQRELSVISAQLKHFRGSYLIKFVYDSVIITLTFHVFDSVLFLLALHVCVMLQCLGSKMQPCGTNFCFRGSIQRVCYF